MMIFIYNLWGRPWKSLRTPVLRHCLITRSSNDIVALRAPSGLPKGKQNLKFVSWCSSKMRNLSLIWVNDSFSSWVTVPTPSGLREMMTNNQLKSFLLEKARCHYQITHDFSHCSLFLKWIPWYHPRFRSLCNFLKTTTQCSKCMLKNGMLHWV